MSALAAIMQGQRALAAMPNAQPPADPAAPAEEWLTPAGVNECMSLLRRQPGFARANCHLSAAELQGLARTPIEWPGTKPVFSPLAATKEASLYTQCKPTVHGTAQQIDAAKK